MWLKEDRVDHDETKTDLLILPRIIQIMRSWDD